MTGCDVRRRGGYRVRWAMIVAVALGAVVPVAASILPAGAQGTGPTFGWTSQPLSTPYAQATLNATSCPSPGNCVAVGSYTGTGNFAQPLIESLVGGTWTAITPVWPAADTPAPQSWSLTGVSCTSPSTCVATGNYNLAIPNELPAQDSFAEVLNGDPGTDAAWSTTVFPIPDQSLTPTSDLSMAAISCVSDTTCVAVGNGLVAPGEGETAVDTALTYTLSGDPTVAGNWTPTFLPFTAGAPTPETPDVVGLNGVSCTPSSDPPPESCVAVGAYQFIGSFDEHVLVDTLAGPNWTLNTLTSNPGTSLSASLTSVSCTATATPPAACVAAGSASDSTGVQAMVESGNGSTWVPTTDLAPGALGSGLSGIACSSAQACVAAGDSIDSTDTVHALVETLSGTGWGPTTGIDPAGLASPSFTGVSCAGAGTCVAVGAGSTASGGIAPFTAEEASPTPTEFVVTAPASAILGAAQTVTVTAVDAATGQIATGYGGLVTLSATDPAATLPPAGVLSNGSGSFTVVFNTLGLWSVTATDAANALVGTSAPVQVGPPPVAPSPPTGLGASGLADEVVLTWSAPANTGTATVTGYLVYRGLASNREAGAPLASTTSTSFVDTTVTHGVQYFYEVKAVSAAGTSPPSNQASASLTAGLPGGHLFAGAAGGSGYWLTSADGAVYSFGGARFYGSLARLTLTQPIVGMAGSPDGRGYWLVASDGGVFAFGDAGFYGSLGHIHLNQPIVGMASSPDGRGYWLVASDGGMFAFGDAHFDGSLGRIHLNQPIVGMAATPDGLGYWLVASDGGMFTFGDAKFLGSLGNLTLNEPIVGMAPSKSGRGYWLVAKDGGIFTFGDTRYYGSLGNHVIPWPILGMIAAPSNTGYSIINFVGNASVFGT